MVSADSPTESRAGGFTLPDLLLLLANGWALPVAVQFHVDVHSAWLWLAFPLGSALAFSLTWQCKKLEWRLWRRFITGETSAQLSSRDRTFMVRVFFALLAASLAFQYLLYYVSAIFIRMLRA
jgi:hypothetical protein